MLPEGLNAEDLNNWIKLAKYHKDLWVKSSEKGDLMPTVFAERNGKVLCSVIAPQVDKELGFKAAGLLRKALDADVLTVIFDCHIYQSKQGENKDEFLKKFKPGMLQKMCDEEGACETGLISDCLTCHRIGKDKKIKMATIPYYYNGRGSKFRWVNDPNGYQEYVIDENTSNVKLEGDVPDTMRKIIDLPSFFDEPEVKAMAEKCNNKFGTYLDRDRQFYHAARAVYTVLSMDR